MPCVLSNLNFAFYFFVLHVRLHNKYICRAMRHTASGDVRCCTARHRNASGVNERQLLTAVVVACSTEWRLARRRPTGRRWSPATRRWRWPTTTLRLPTWRRASRVRRAATTAPWRSSRWSSSLDTRHPSTSSRARSAPRRGIPQRRRHWSSSQTRPSSSSQLSSVSANCIRHHPSVSIPLFPFFRSKRKLEENWICERRFFNFVFRWKMRN